MRSYRRALYLLAGLIFLLPIYGSAEPIEKSILITEIQTGSTSSASEEFIELYNASSDAIDISDWRVQYFAAFAADFENPYRSIPLSGILLPESYYLLASNDYLVDLANGHFSAALAKTGGHLRLVSPDPAVEGAWIQRDLVGWGTAVLAETSPAPAPDGGESIERQVDETEMFIDSDDNANDFAINLEPSPQSDPTGTPTVTIEEDPSVPTEDEQAEQQSEVLQQEAADFEPIQISELLPNPTPPISDGDGEFVELYNPNNRRIDISNFKLQTGSSYSYAYVFENTVLEPNSYTAFYVSQTDTLLANSGGRARLLGPDGSIQSESALYETAKDGQGWILYKGVWQWSTVTTPNAPNIFSIPKVLGDTPKKKASTRRVLAKTQSAGKKKTKAAGARRSEYEEPPADEQVAPVHPGVLAVVGGMALTYGAYEYRNDFINKLRLFRRNRTARG